MTFHVLWVCWCAAVTLARVIWEVLKCCWFVVKPCGEADLQRSWERRCNGPRFLGKVGPRSERKLKPVLNMKLAGKAAR